VYYDILVLDHKKIFLIFRGKDEGLISETPGVGCRDLLVEHLTRTLIMRVLFSNSPESDHEHAISLKLNFNY